MNNIKPSIIEPTIGCIAQAMKIIGNKWTALILRDLFIGPQRFCQLEKSIPEINPRILSQRLIQLESEGIIKSELINPAIIRKEYSLTQKGRDLLPILKQMAIWGEIYHNSN